jgi:O-antigen/teichoic acid export membrane protein
VLVFLYPRYASNQLNGVLFQAALTASLLAIFLFAISGVYFFEVVAMKKMSTTAKIRLRRRGEVLFVLGLIIATGQPALILFTLGLTVVALIATVLWALYGGFVMRQGRNLRND